MDSVFIKEMCKVITKSFSAGGAVIIDPALVGVLGMSSAGIAAGSYAAYLMSLFGPTWLIAILQSAGTFRWDLLGPSFSALVGGAMGKIICTVCNVTVKYEL